MVITVLSTSLVGESVRFRASAADVIGTIARVVRMRQERLDDESVHTFCLLDCAGDPNGRNDRTGWYDCDETELESINEEA